MISLFSIKSAPEKSMNKHDILGVFRFKNTICWWNVVNAKKNSFFNNKKIFGDKFLREIDFREGKEYF